MRKRQVILTAVSIVLVGGFLLSANSAHAELISAVTNPSFESPAYWDGGSSGNISNWEETQDGATDSTFQRNLLDSETPGPTDGDQVALLVIRQSGPITESRIWQSLGAVAAGDVGQIIDVSANMWARGDNTGLYEGGAMWMYVSKDVTSSSTGTAIALDGDSSVLRSDGVQDFSLSYTVQSGDLDDELFLQFVLSGTVTGCSSGQYYVDNIDYAVVPEPSTFVLLAIAALGGMLVWWRRRK